MPENPVAAPSQPAPTAQPSDAVRSNGPENVGVAQYAQQFLKTPAVEATPAPEAQTAETPVSPAEPAPEAQPEPVTAPEVTEDADVLSQPTSLTPEQQEAFNKRVGKLTAQRRQAEREAEALRLEVAQLRQQQPSEQPKPSAPDASLSNITTISALETLHNQATEAVRFAEYNLDRDDVVEHEGQKGVTVDGTFYTKAQLREIKYNAQATRDTQIPARSRFLQQQHQHTQKAFEIYPELKDSSSPEYHAAMEAYRDNPWLQNLPNSALIVGRMILGTKAESERIKAKAAPVVAAKPIIKAKPSGDQTAVSASGTVSRAPIASANRAAVQQEQVKLAGKGGVTAKEYAAFLQKTEQLR